MMFSRPRSSRDIAAYRVVVLPEPVGPVTSTMPCGSRISRSIEASVISLIPSTVRSSRAASLSRSRSTTRSPGPVGNVDTRTSTLLSPSLSAMRPSCGSRFSAMSRLAITLSRDTSAACSARGGSMTSLSTPSTRNRTTERVSYGSKCRSEARSRNACSSSALIIRITGASEVGPSRSSALGMSCSNRARSVSREKSSVNCATGDAWL